MRLLLISLALPCSPPAASAQTGRPGTSPSRRTTCPNRNRTVGAADARVRGAGPRPDAAAALHVVRLCRRAPRAQGSGAPPGRTDVRAAILRVQEASARFTTSRFDLLAGVSRVVWGRLDEVQPTDVINPLDVSRFFFEGRSEARLPVALIRARAFLSEDATIEGVYVPFYRRGRFDQLDEPTSPFNIEAGASAPRCAGRDRAAGAAGGVRQRAGRRAVQRNHRPRRLERRRVSRLRAVRVRRAVTAGGRVQFRSCIRATR